LSGSSVYSGCLYSPLVRPHGVAPSVLSPNHNPKPPIVSLPSRTPSPCCMDYLSLCPLLLFWFVRVHHFINIFMSRAPKTPPTPGLFEPLFPHNGKSSSLGPVHSFFCAAFLIGFRVTKPSCLTPAYSSLRYEFRICLVCACVFLFPRVCFFFLLMRPSAPTPPFFTVSF